jgi:hypothetical protein
LSAIFISCFLSPFLRCSLYSALFLISQPSTGSAARVRNYAHCTKCRNNAFIRGTWMWA